MKFRSLVEYELYFRHNICQDMSIEERYPKRNFNVGGGGYSKPASDVMESIVWVWLQWHLHKDIKSIQDMLKPMVNRSLKMMFNPEISDYFREDHDHFLMQLAVLSGSKDLRLTVANSVITADANPNKCQYYQAWTGILKYRILGDERGVKRQYDILQNQKALHYYLSPTRKTIASFVERDYKVLGKAIKQRSERFWKFAEHWKAMDVQDGEQIIDVKKLYLNTYWPWVECTFAKLAYIDSADFTYDSIWLPLELIKAIEE